MFKLGKPRLKGASSFLLLTAGLLITGFSAHASLQTQTAQSSPITIFEDVTLSPEFVPDALTVRGVSGGAIAATDLASRNETATGACAGFIDEQPDHRVDLTEYFNSLSLQIQSSEDTTLVIRGPGGVWCNDDYSGKNPGIAGQWLSGTYEIWIGSFQQNSYHPYVIKITETAT
jgi:hypothetical protein